MRNGVDPLTICQAHEDLLHQVFDLAVPANALLKKTHQWGAGPPRQGLEDLITAV
jgi:hypothetical protein